MGLRGKLLTRILLPVAVLVAVLWIYERGNNRADALETAKLRLDSAASTAAELLEYRIQEFNTILTGVLTQDAVANYFAFLEAGQFEQAEQVRASLENSCKRLFLHTPNLQSIELFDSSGERFVSVVDRSLAQQTENVSEREWFQDASLQPYTVTCMSGSLMRLARVEPLLQEAGRVTGSMVLDIARIAEPIFGFATRDTEDVRSRLVCQHGQLIFGLGSGIVEGERIRMEAPQSFCSGQLVYEQSRASALASAKRIETRGLMIAALTLFALLVTVWVGLHKIVLQPASKLLEVILAFERGEDIPETQAEEVLGDELAKLDVAFRGAIECERRSTNSLIELNQSLEGRVAERTRELATARDEALAASRAKSAFLANMSHEIRTPMNGVIGMADLLMDTELDEEQREFVDTVRSSSGSLLTIINDVLDFSKIEAGRMELEQVSFVPKQTIDEVFHLLSISAKQKGLELRLELSEAVSQSYLGDSVRLRQVITNLVSNAIKFTDQGRVTIRARAEEETEDETVLRFEVEDTGCGVSPEAQSKIFSVFSQADNSTTRKFGGTGLGLSICKSLVELMDGEIGIESEERAFSLFWFTARFRNAPGATAGESEPISSETEAARPDALDPSYLLRTTASLLGRGARSQQILLAEDNVVNQAVATRVLQRLGYQVDVAQNGREAVELLEQKDYGVVLMDCQMPEMDGYQATARIREGGGGRSDIPVIAMTANAMKGDRERCLEAGMDDYVTKPIDTKVLAEKLAHWLGHRPTASS